MVFDVYFEVTAGNGLVVRTTGDYRRKIITFKHPAMASKEEDVKLALQQPDEIRQSTRSDGVLLYYRRSGQYHTCVVVRTLDGEGFIITAYVTDRVKEGRSVWKR